MSRIGFCICGFITGTPLETPPVNGWWMLEIPLLNPGFSGNSSNPIGFTVEDYRRLFWNIQELTLTYNLTITPAMGGPPPTNPMGTLVAEMSDGGGTVVPDELGLVKTTGTAQFPASDANASLLFSFGVNFTQFAPGSTLPCWPNGFDISFEYLNSFGLPARGTINNFLGYFACPVTISSTSLPWVNAFVFQQQTDPSDPTEPTITGSMTLEATAYWEYDNSLSPPPGTNGPIFDATTGVQLITPAPLGF